MSTDLINGSGMSYDVMKVTSLLATDLRPEESNVTLGGQNRRDARLCLNYLLVWLINCIKMIQLKVLSQVFLFITTFWAVMYAGVARLEKMPTEMGTHTTSSDKNGRLLHPATPLSNI